MPNKVLCFDISGHLAWDMHDGGWEFNPTRLTPTEIVALSIAEFAEFERKQRHTINTRGWFCSWARIGIAQSNEYH